MDRLPPLTALRAFEAVVRTGSISAAAEELHVTHSAVSHQVRGLERDLGTLLLTRRGRGVVPTIAGDRLARSLTDAFAGIARAVVAARPETGAREITVSCLGTFLLQWLIPRIYRFKAAWPGIQLKMVEEFGPLLEAASARDVAIRVTRPPWPKAFDVTVLEKETIGPVMAPGLAERGAVRTPADLAGAPLVQTRTRPTAWTDWAAAAGVDVPEGGAVTWFDHYYFLLEGVRGGLGLGVVPEQLIRDDLARGLLVAPFGFACSGNVYIVATAAGNSDPAVAAFRDWLVTEFRGGQSPAGAGPNSISRA